MELKVYLLGGVGNFFKRLSAEVEYQFFKTSNVNLVSKLVVFFTLRAVAPQTDILLGKPRDFRAFQSSLGLPIESLSLFSKNFFLIAD